MDTARATGKTFRRLLKALSYASEGKRVIYVTAHAHLKQWYCNRAWDICSAYLSPDTFSRPNQRVICIDGAGRIEFYSQNELHTLRGIKVDKSITDD